MTDKKPVSFTVKDVFRGVRNDCSLSRPTQELETKTKQNRFQIQSKQKEMLLYILPAQPFKSTNVSHLQKNNFVSATSF